MIYLGDYEADQPVYFAWNTNDSDGASITRATDGTISVYKDNSDGSSFDATQVTTGVTNDEDFDSLTGVHTCCITTTDAWYETGHDYIVVLSGSTIDGQTVNAVLAHFSIENRAAKKDLANATDGLGALKSLIDAIKAKTDNLPADPADDSDIDSQLSTIDSVVDAIKAKTDNLPASPAAVGSAMTLSDDAITSAKFDESTAFPVKSADNGATQIARVGADGDTLETISDQIDGIGGDATAANQTTIINHLTDVKGGTFNGSTDSLEAIRDRGDAAWITGGGGGITDMIHIHPIIPQSIDLADTVTWRFGLFLTNMLDDLPSTAEITPGTITIERKSYGGTSWTTVVNAEACSEAAGMIYYDEVFDSSSGYRPGDSIRATFKSQKVTVAANDYEIAGTDGWPFHTYIRGVERADTSTATHTYTVLDGSGNGIQDVLVEAKLTGTDVLVQSARTNSSGVASFYLAPGTYDFYATKSGYSFFSNPDQETVS